MNEFMKAAWDEAKIGLDEGNLPVGSVVVKDGQIIGVGRNRQHQTGDPTTHAELEAIRGAARRAPGQDPVDLLKNAICYTTMMPCPMCAGAIIRFGFSKVVVAETQSYVDAGTQPLMERQGLSIEVRREESCIELVESYYQDHPEIGRIMKSAARGQLKL